MDMLLLVILKITLSNVLDYIVIPGAFVIFLIGMYRLLKNPDRIKKALEEDNKEEGLK